MFLSFILECGDPVLVANSVSTGDGTSFEQSHKVSCIDGYTLSGTDDDVIICQSNGTWTDLQYSCEKGIMLMKSALFYKLYLMTLMRPAQKSFS